jgi:hypothetical protein
MTFLIFNTEAAAIEAQAQLNTEARAIEAQDQLFFNEMLKIANENNGKIFTNDLQEVEFSSLTRQEVLDSRIFYFKNGQKVFDSGYVTQIVSVKKAFNLDKWFFERIGIQDNLVFDDEIESIPTEWFETTITTDPSELPDGVIISDIVTYD